MFDFRIHFAAGALIDNPYPCEHGFAYVSKLGLGNSTTPIWVDDEAEFIPDLVRRLRLMRTAPRTGAALASMPVTLHNPDGIFIDPFRGVGILNLEIEKPWRKLLLARQRRYDPAAVDATIRARLDLIAYLAGAVWERDIAYCGSEDSSFAFALAPMMYFPGGVGWDRYDVHPKIERFVPVIWNKSAVPGNPPLTTDQEKELGRSLVAGNSEVGFHRGVIAWSDAATAETQLAFVEWVRGFEALCGSIEAQTAPVEPEVMAA